MTLALVHNTPRVWYKDIDAFLLTIAGFQRCADEPNVYFKGGTPTPGVAQTLVILLLYVDNILLFSPRGKALEPVMKQLEDKYEMSSMGDASIFLGLQIERNREKYQLFLHQGRYIDSMMDQFGMANCTTYATPMETTCKLDKLATLADKHLDEEDEVHKTLYKSMVGKLMYAMIGTRPDIVFAVSYLGRFANSPTTSHLSAAKRVLGYLRGTRNYDLRFGSSIDSSIGSSIGHSIGYSDSDWAGDRDTRKSTSGYIFTYAGGAISWKSCRQRVVACSSTEAEYYALDEACKESLWLTRVGLYLGIDFKGIMVDNTGALQLASNDPRHGRTKHMDVRYRHIRQCVEEKEVVLSQVSTSDNVADILTKPLPRDSFERHARRMGLLKSMDE